MPRSLPARRRGRPLFQLPGRERAGLSAVPGRSRSLSYRNRRSSPGGQRAPGGHGGRAPPERPHRSLVLLGRLIWLGREPPHGTRHSPAPLWLTEAPPNSDHGQARQVPNDRMPISQSFSPKHLANVVIRETVRSISRRKGDVPLPEKGRVCLGVPGAELDLGSRCAFLGPEPRSPYLGKRREQPGWGYFEKHRALAPAPTARLPK